MPKRQENGKRKEENAEKDPQAINVFLIIFSFKILKKGESTCVLAV